MYRRYKGNDRGRVIVEREEGDDKSREREGSLHRSSCRSHRRAPPLDSRWSLTNVRLVNNVWTLIEESPNIKKKT